MKIAFLGKGGSGKSTMATALVRALHARGMRVLAIDADHNMDLTYNLGLEPSVFLGTDPNLIKEHLGAKRDATYRETLEHGTAKGALFTLSPIDAYTQQISTPLNDTLRVVTAGPHTDRVRSQESCSHSLAAPLKAYLPLLKLNENEVVIIDERAGTDPVATGILSGVDLAIIVRENTVNSTRVADQIRQELIISGIPHIIIDNKVEGIEMDSARMVDTVLAWRSK